MINAAESPSKIGQRRVFISFGNMKVISNLGKNEFTFSGLKVSA